MKKPSDTRYTPKFPSTPPDVYDPSSMRFSLDTRTSALSWIPEDCEIHRPDTLTYKEYLSVKDRMAASSPIPEDLRDKYINTPSPLLRQYQAKLDESTFTLDELKDLWAHYKSYSEKRLTDPVDTTEWHNPATTVRKPSAVSDKKAFRGPPGTYNKRKRKTDRTWLKWPERTSIQALVAALGLVCSSAPLIGPQAEKIGARLASWSEETETAFELERELVELGKRIRRSPGPLLTIEWRTED